jgi:hypothetical protein
MAVFTKEVVYEAAAKVDQHPMNVLSALKRDVRDGIAKNFDGIVPIESLIEDFAAQTPEGREAEATELNAIFGQREEETSAEWRMRTTKDFCDWRLEHGYWTQAQYDEWADAVKRNKERRI